MESIKLIITEHIMNMQSELLENITKNNDVNTITYKYVDMYNQLTKALVSIALSEIELKSEKENKQIK